jgi:hypothetical protein
VVKTKIDYGSHDEYFKAWAKAEAAAAAAPAVNKTGKVRAQPRKQPATTPSVSLLALVSGQMQRGTPLVCGVVAVDREELFNVIEGKSREVGVCVKCVSGCLYGVGI